MIDIILDQIVGIIILIAAFFYIKYQPKRVNSYYGFRTARSMKNDKNWEYSNKLAAKYMLVVGILSLIIGVPFSVYSKSEYAGMANMIVTIIGLVAIIPIIDNKLKKLEQEAS